MKNLYALIFYFFFFSLQAQDYYYNGHEKVEVYRSENDFISYGTPNQTIAKGFATVKTFSSKGFTLLENKRVNFSMLEFGKQNLDQVFPALLLSREDEFKMFLTKTIRVKLKSNTNKTQLDRILPKGNVVRVTEKYGILRIELNDIHMILEIANQIYESGLVDFSIPDFYIPIALNQVNDPLFPLQFQMHNTGQVIDGVAGVNDIDCNALEAWNVTLGNNVTVAVFDEGLENHEDFGNRLIGGFTPATNGNGAPLANNAIHGMNCAGIIGASDDGLGLRGVAPNVNFLSVNISANGTTSGDIADGFQWAIDNGADVLSNSWSYPNAPCSFTDFTVENAIQNAVNNGRNGNGSVVVFSSGNTGGCVNYPARSNNAISVGAIDLRGNLFNYSARGAELDLVAPSGQTGYLGNVRTTDRMGNAGRVAGHYEPSFGGTSAACPVVAGAAALVLSIDPSLTAQEVRNVLTSTATDMGAAGFDNNFGFGRVNAFAAVRSLITLSGPGIVCSSNTTFNLQGLNNPTWSTSFNLSTVSSNSNSITVKALSSFVGGQGYVRATFANGFFVQEDFWVGKANVDNVSFSNGIGEVEYFCSSHVGNTYKIFPRIPGVTHQIRLKKYPNLNTVYQSSLNYSGDQGTLSYTPSPGWYLFEVRRTNDCGLSNWFGFEVEFVDCSLGGGGEFEYFAYPNPSSQSVTIQKKSAPLNEASNGDGPEYRIFDFNSNLIFQGLITGGQTTINVSRLKKGRYILKIYGIREEETHHIIVE